MTFDTGNWKFRWTCSKYTEDFAPWLDAGWSSPELQGIFKPYEVHTVEGNILVNTGIGLLEDLLIGAGGTVYSNANSRIGVGDSTTAAAAGQTDLQAATNKLRKVMDATFPSRSGQTVSWQASFTTSEANFAWQEWAVFNAASAGTMLNRKVEALGSKVSGTWVLLAALTIS